MHELELPEVAIITAMTKYGVIGSDKELPWNLPEDLKLFKRLTYGKTVLMGRKTYESIGHPLQGRENIVLSKSLQSLPGAYVCKEFCEGLRLAKRLARPVYVLGGVNLYRRSLPIASTLHISWVKKPYPGDILFPNIDFSEWIECDRQKYIGFCYVRYVRKGTG